MEIDHVAPAAWTEAEAEAEQFNLVVPAGAGRTEAVVESPLHSHVVRIGAQEPRNSTWIVQSGPQVACDIDAGTPSH
ncbi:MULTISPECIES: hypothetical protein [Streptomyces]|uniref:hypothetical protein n=1 Tax=Streptomyces TaxID=1883 RepID=UPI0034615450